MATPEMDPMMKVNESVEGDDRIFELVLSRANLNHLLAGCPDVDCLIGRSRGGISFRLFPEPLAEMPKTFRLASDGYYAFIGRPVEALPTNFTKEEFDRLAEKSDRGLIETIKKRGRIPMEMRTEQGDINAGFVKIRIEV
jgi:hypothetical protein